MNGIRTRTVQILSLLPPTDCATTALNYWCHELDSNQPHTDFQSAALPDELPRQNLLKININICMNNETTPYIWRPAKAYWLREEIPIADELLSLAPALTKEFLDYHEDFINGNFAKCKTYVNPTFDPSVVQSRADAWKTDGIKYTYKEANIHRFEKLKKWLRFPTAIALTEKYGNDCPISTYSIIESNAVIERHTGIENRDNEFIRIHIPLIIPDGDIFFECEGAEIDWTDIWGFDNQLVHSAHNYTPHRRLIYLIDIRRSVLGIENGEKYDPRRQYQVPKFERGAIPKVLHSHQKT